MANNFYAKTMSYLNKTVLTVVLTCFVLSLNGATGNKDSVRYDILLSSQLLSDMRISGDLTGIFDITSKQVVLFSTADQFYLLGLGNIVPFGNKTKASVGSFAFTPDSILMAIQNNGLCYIDSLGNLTQLFKLPNPGMGISAGKYVMYLYERNSTKNRNALYVLAQGGKYIKLIEMPKPINSVVEFNNSLLFCTENAVLQYNLSNKTLKALAILPDKDIIKSLTVNPMNGRVYFSTSNRIYSIKDTSLILIADELGGTLRYFNGLIVFDPGKKIMIRLAGSDDAIAATTEPEKIVPMPDQPVVVLTNSTIVELVKEQLSDEIIINIIEHSRVDFNLTVEAMIELSNQHVSSRVILAMKQAMKKQPSLTE
jgi:hypothetical protein